MSTDKDIYPRTPLSHLSRDRYAKELEAKFPIELVAPVVGFNESFIRRALGKREATPTLSDVLQLLELDAFTETFVPRSKIPDYLLKHSNGGSGSVTLLNIPTSQEMHHGCSKELIQRVPSASIQCVVTSTPYWATRIYEDNITVEWADGEACPYGPEQTPEAFIRHSVELLYLLRRCLKPAASVWWNIMDTYNTRTQIRGNAAETLKAMQGLDKRGWLDHEMRRYSAGHAYLKDGEQCLIPHRIAARASKVGYYLKSVITWAKGQSMPETVDSRVTRELEYILHLSPVRTPYFDKSAYLSLPPDLGGRNAENESLKLTDVWHFCASPGRDGHGAQFPLELPGRCIALTTHENDLVLDPFAGSGTTLLAAHHLRRPSFGFDISQKYVDTANQRLKSLYQQAGKKTSRKNQPELFPLQDIAENPNAKKRYASQ
jgi:hypothetical protein